MTYDHKIPMTVTPEVAEWIEKLHVTMQLQNIQYFDLIVSGKVLFHLELIKDSNVAKITP